MPSCSFKHFSCEWGALMVQDPSVSLDHLLDTYQHAYPSDARTATIEDYTDLWTAAKRANVEWEATCMVRSVRQSVAIDGAVTLFHLMTSMTCWAATLHQRAADFFKVCKTQVRDVMSHVVARCTAWAGEEDASELYQEIAFCVALELFGWHDSLLTCLWVVASQYDSLSDEQDVLLFTATVSQYLTPKHLPRSVSMESTPNITTGRTSALSSSSERDTMPHSHHRRHHNGCAAAKNDGTAVVVDCLPSPSSQQQQQQQQCCATSENATSLHVKLEHTRAVDTERGRDGDNERTQSTAASAARQDTASSPTTSSSTSPHFGGPPLHTPPASPTRGRNPLTVPQQAPRSCSTPQVSPKNATASVRESVIPLPPRICDSATTTAAHARDRKDEIREKGWPIVRKGGRNKGKKATQSCVPF